MERIIHSKIPKGFNHSAQGCDEGATLGGLVEGFNLEKVESSFDPAAFNFCDPPVGF
jgi:hypothetical protein